MNRPHSVLSVLLAGVLVSLAPLAYATPPDPGWISGFWDDGDHDDVVIRITASTGVVELFPLDDVCSLQLVTVRPHHTDERSPSSDAFSVIHARAPPTS